jgi:Mannosyltransferase (PIG-V)
MKTTKTLLWFDLNTYIQRKYWNVGFLRYWQWKQIPNFILAFPILYVSTKAVISWIQWSWNYTQQQQQQQRRQQQHQHQRTMSTLMMKMNGHYRIISSIMKSFFHWIVSALRDFVAMTDERSTLFLSTLKEQSDNDDDDEKINIHTPTEEQQKQQQNEQQHVNPDDMIISILMGSPILLGNYAVLAASVMLGLFVAHVQISTRLICSSCPALYWYMTACLIKDYGVYERKQQQKKRHQVKIATTAKITSKSSLSAPVYYWTMSDGIIGWCILYIVLGSILHPNW